MAWRSKQKVTATIHTIRGLRKLLFSCAGRKLTCWCAAMTSWRSARATRQSDCSTGMCRAIWLSWVKMASRSRVGSVTTLTSLALEHLAFIDAIVQLIEGHETGHGAAPTIVVKCKGSVGFNHLRLHLRHSSLFLFRRPDLVDHKSRCHSSNFRPIPAGWANSKHNRSRGAGGRWLSWLLGCDAPPAL